MKYCRHCGKELADGAVVCPGCGCAVEAIREKKISGETAGNGKSICAMIFGILALAFFLISESDVINNNIIYTFILILVPLCELLAFTFLAVGGLKKKQRQDKCHVGCRACLRRRSIVDRHSCGFFKLYFCINLYY